MEHELIQTWLQLPAGRWPPDHYTLLGIDPAESDTARIEQQVHARMDQVRSYQLTHPELATEAMNCLARALVCLTDPQARKAYDQALFSGPVGPEKLPAKAPQATTGKAETPLAEDQKLSDWQTSPPPLRQPPEVFWPASLEAMSKDTVDNLLLPGPEGPDTATDTPPVAPPQEQSNGKDILPELTGFARLGLGSKRALYYQIVRTRQLLWAWEQVGKYLNRPTRLVNHPAEATDLLHHMGVIRDLLPSMTPALGQAGQPGYLVLALARQQLIVPMLQTLLPSQREALARDWQAGYAVLRNARQFLRQEVRTVRRRRGWRHVLRLIGAGLRRHPGLVVLLLGWLALNIAVKVPGPPVLAEYLPGCPEQLIYRLADYLPGWPEQIICLLALAGIRLALWLYSFQPVRRASVPKVKEKMPKKKSRTRRRPDSSRV